MANIHIVRHHTLGLDGAKTQVETIAESLKRDLQADYQWEGDTLHFKRTGASGTIQIDDCNLILDVKLGMALGVMKGKIEERINSNLDRVLTA